MIPVYPKLLRDMLVLALVGLLLSVVGLLVALRADAAEPDQRAGCATCDSLPARSSKK